MKYPKNANLWLPAYLKDRATTRNRRPAKRLWVALTDHYEPLGGPSSVEIGVARVAAWQNLWPRIANNAPHDASGRPPCFTFFYPQEDYHEGIVESLAELTRTGITDVEVHIHHNHDTVEIFREKMTLFLNQLHNNHGLLRFDEKQKDRLTFGFIHGNWALDNSRPDGLWCGVKGELQALRDLGCFADFTMPSLPSPTQSRILNQVYWTTGDPQEPRGFDQGIEATIGGGRRGDLLMITGPTGIRFKDRLMPRLETGELACYDPPTRNRVLQWLDLAPRVGDDIFLKLYGHSAREDNAAVLLGTGNHPGTLAPMFQWIHEITREQGIELHWASAYDMFRAVDNLIHARTGQPT